MLPARIFLPHYRNLSVRATRSPDYYPRYNSSMASSKTLDFYSGPLVWVDCEMTGLNPRKDKILEIAVRVISN